MYIYSCIVHKNAFLRKMYKENDNLLSILCKMILKQYVFILNQD